MAAHSSVLAWRIPWTEATVHGVTRSQTQPRGLSTFVFTHMHMSVLGPRQRSNHQLIPRGHGFWWEVQASSLELSLALETKEDKILVQSLMLQA